MATHPTDDAQTEVIGRAPRRHREPYRWGTRPDRDRTTVVPQVQPAGIARAFQQAMLGTEEANRQQRRQQRLSLYIEARQVAWTTLVWLLVLAATVALGIGIAYGWFRLTHH